MGLKFIDFSYLEYYFLLKNDYFIKDNLLYLSG